MDKKILMGLVVGVVVVAGGGWLLLGRKAGENVVTAPLFEPTAIPTVEQAQMTGEMREFMMEGSSFKFEPAEMRVKRGDTVKVVFKSMGGMHDFVIDEFEVRTNQVGEGEEEEVEFVADHPGTFEYYCSVGNHRAMGMKGRLEVEQVISSGE